MNTRIRLPSVSMSVEIEYLLQFLQDEFRDLEDLRIHPVAPSGMTKSPDLTQNYDPNESKVHLSRGVRVRVSSRDYFFPADWVIEGKTHLVRELAEEVRSYYLSKNQ